jgi:hypothetical protein
LANNLASTSTFGPTPCQDITGIPPSWQYLDRSLAPIVSQHYMGQPNSSNQLLNRSSAELARSAPI